MELSEKKEFLVLGIDPGLRTSGYGLVSGSNGQFRLLEAGVVCPVIKQPLASRLGELFINMRDMAHEFKPHAIAIEELYSKYPFARSGILLAQARGALCAAAAAAGIAVFGYTQTQARKTLTGNGRASRMQIDEAVRRILKIRKLPSSSDAIDALSFALCHLHVGEGE